MVYYRGLQTLLKNVILRPLWKNIYFMLKRQSYLANAQLSVVTAILGLLPKGLFKGKKERVETRKHLSFGLIRKKIKY